MKSADWISMASEALGKPTARALAEKIGINEATLSQHKSGKAKTLNDDNCLVIAEICGLDPLIVIADQQAERASPAVRKIYERARKLASETMVPRDGIEPPTRGFSIFVNHRRQNTFNMPRRGFQMIPTQMRIAQYHLNSRPATQLH